jgi:CBS domain-containing protein
MNVEEIMTDEVHTATSDMTVKAAAEAMSRRKIGSLIVVDGNKLKGIITERDIMSKVVSMGRDASKTRVRDVMTKELIYIEPNCDVDEAAQKMVENQIKKLPVVSDNRLIGMITAMDIVTAEPKITEQISSLVTFVKKKKFVAG